MTSWGSGTPGTHAGIMRVARMDAFRHSKTMPLDGAGALAGAAGGFAGSEAASPTGAATVATLGTRLKRRTLATGVVLALDVSASHTLTTVSLFIVYAQVCGAWGAGYAVRGLGETPSPQPPRQSDSLRPTKHILAPCTCSAPPARESYCF